MIIVFSILGAIVLALAVVLIILAVNSGDKPKPFTDANGNEIAGSISEKCFTEINGFNEGMFIKGESTDKPILLFVHGGPGMAQYFMVDKYLKTLEKNFLVCYPEQRGSGLSYSDAVKKEDITLEGLASDISEIAKYLCKRFDKEKVYLMAHSGGTPAAAMAATNTPELFYAYIAMSQISDNVKSEQLNYEYMIKLLEEQGDTSSLNELKKYNPYGTNEEFNNYQLSMTRDSFMHKLGIGTMRSMKSVFSDIFLPIMGCNAYSLSEKMNIWRGKFFYNTTEIHSEINTIKLAETHNTFEIPIYFFVGRYDYTVNRDVQREYFDAISAPIKGFYTFENSAHSPLFEEEDKAVAILTSDVINGTNELAD